MYLWAYAIGQKFEFVLIKSGLQYNAGNVLSLNKYNRSH